MHAMSTTGGQARNAPANMLRQRYFLFGHYRCTSQWR